MRLRHLFFLFILFSALSVQAVAQAAGQGAVDDLTARAGTPQDMARHYQQITHKLAAGDPQGAWALARQVLDFQHMPAEFLHLIAQVAEAAHSPELALSIIQRSLDSYPEDDRLQRYGLYLSVRAGQCGFVAAQSAYYSLPRRISWRDSYDHIRQLCEKAEPTSQTEFSLRMYRGYLPYHGRTAQTVTAEPGSVLYDFCTVYDQLCPASAQFSYDGTAGAARRLILHTALAQRSFPTPSTALTLSWDHYQILKRLAYGDEIEIAFDYFWPSRKGHITKAGLTATGFASQPEPPARALSAHRLGLEIARTRPTGLHHAFLPEKWGWLARYTQHINRGGALFVSTGQLFQHWQFTGGTFHLSYEQSVLDHPADAPAGDAVRTGWSAELQTDNRSLSPSLGRIFPAASLFYARSVTNYQRAFIWLARPHQTDKTSIGLSAIMPPLYKTLRPHFTIERQISRSRHIPEDYRHWTISVAMVKKF